MLAVLPRALLAGTRAAGEGLIDLVGDPQDDRPLAEPVCSSVRATHKLPVPSAPTDPFRRLRSSQISEHLARLHLMIGDAAVDRLDLELTLPLPLTIA